MLRLILFCVFNQATTAALAPYVQIMFRNKGYSHSVVGVIIAVGQIATVIIPMLVGLISDKTRKTKLLFIVIGLLSALIFIPVATSSSMMVTIMAYFLASGIFWSAHPIADGYETRLLKGDSEKYGMIRSAGTMGYIVCLLLFGLTGFPDESDNNSICVAIALVCSAFAIVSFFIPKDIPASRSEKKEKLTLRSLSGRFYLMMLLVGLSRIAQAVIEKLLSSYMMEELGLGGSFVNYVALGAFCEFLMILFGGRLLQKGKVSAYTMIFLSFIGLGVRLLIYWLFPSRIGFTIAQTLHALTFGALHIGVTKFIAQNVDPSHYSVAQSFYWAIATNLPEMFGALVGGFIIDSLGYRNLFAIYSVFPLVAAFLCILFRRMLGGSDKA
ncbi:MAG: MFS transporter [Spirochaetales bacterium]|nr:MFS transporter [Spirochaetales bacterium]